MYEYFLQKCKSAYSPKQELSLDEAMIPWPKQDPPSRLSRDFSKHKLDKIVAGGKGKNKYPESQCKVCAAHMK
jgi:hypothetical protein